MSASILVAFATRYGSTRKVAEVVASTLHERGLEVEIQPMNKVRTLDGYRAVVLGAPLYIGRWHKDAQRLCARKAAVQRHTGLELERCAAVAARRRFVCACRHPKLVAGHSDVIQRVLQPARGSPRTAARAARRASGRGARRAAGRAVPGAGGGQRAQAQQQPESAPLQLEAGLPLLSPCPPPPRYRITIGR